MNTHGDSEASAWADLLLSSLSLILFSEPDLPLPPDEVPYLVGLEEASSDRSGLGWKGAVDDARLFRCKELPDLGPVRRRIIGVLGQLLRHLLYPPAMTCPVYLLLLSHASATLLLLRHHLPLLSSRFEKVAQPSNREDIDYQDRWQLGLVTLLGSQRLK